MYPAMHGMPGQFTPSLTHYDGHGPRRHLQEPLTDGLGRHGAFIMSAIIATASRTNVKWYF